MQIGTESNMSIYFYQPFGQTMNNAVGFLSQSALANPAHLNAAAVLQQNPARGIRPTAEAL
jgi:hypothetical protein